MDAYRRDEGFYARMDRVRPRRIFSIGETADGMAAIGVDGDAEFHMVPLHKTQPFVSDDPLLPSVPAPSPGDYLVEYEDGYLSIIPAAAFEWIYSRDVFAPAEVQ